MKLFFATFACLSLAAACGGSVDPVSIHTDAAIERYTPPAPRTYETTKCATYNSTATPPVLTGDIIEFSEPHGWHVSTTGACLGARDVIVGAECLHQRAESTHGGVLEHANDNGVSPTCDARWSITSDVSASVCVRLTCERGE